MVYKKLSCSTSVYFFVITRGLLKYILYCIVFPGQNLEGILMDEHYRQKIEGRLINRFLKKVSVRLPIKALLALKELAGTKKDISLLQQRGIEYVDELVKIDYGRLANILGQEKAEYVLMVIGLYGLRDDRGSKIHGDPETTTTEVVTG